MIRLFANANYDFIKWRRWAYGLTAALIVPGFALFLVHGLNYSIEFTGGTLIQVQTTTPVGTGKIRTALDAAGIRDAEIQQFGGANERSEEHTSELQSLAYLVCRLLLEKKKKKQDILHNLDSHK